MEGITWDLFRETLLEQAEQGVDYFTIHAGAGQHEVLGQSRHSRGVTHRLPIRRLLSLLCHRSESSAKVGSQVLGRKPGHDVYALYHAVP